MVGGNFLLLLLLAAVLVAAAAAVVVGAGVPTCTFEPPERAGAPPKMISLTKYPKFNDGSLTLPTKCFR